MTKELFWLYIVPTLGLLVVDTVFIYKEAKQGAVLSHCWKLLVVDLITKGLGYKKKAFCFLLIEKIDVHSVDSYFESHWCMLLGYNC